MNFQTFDFSSSFLHLKKVKTSFSAAACKITISNEEIKELENVKMEFSLGWAFQFMKVNNNFFTHPFHIYKLSHMIITFFFFSYE